MYSLQKHTKNNDCEIDFSLKSLYLTKFILTYFTIYFIKPLKVRLEKILVLHIKGHAFILKV